MNEGGLRNSKNLLITRYWIWQRFFTSGYRVTGKVTCYQGGHQLSNMFLRNVEYFKFIRNI